MVKEINKDHKGLLFYVTDNITTYIVNKISMKPDLTKLEQENMTKFTRFTFLLTR